MTRDEASRFLKLNGFNMKQLAEFIGIKPNSLYFRWRNGLSSEQVAILQGFVAMQPEAKAKPAVNPDALKPVDRAFYQWVKTKETVTRSELENPDSLSEFLTTYESMASSPKLIAKVRDRILSEHEKWFDERRSRLQKDGVFLDKIDEGGIIRYRISNN